MKDALIDIGLIAAQIIGYAVATQTVSLVLFKQFATFWGVVIGTIVFLPPIVKWFIKEWQPPWRRTWGRVKRTVKRAIGLLFSFDFEIDTSPKVKPKNELDRNPLDDD